MPILFTFRTHGHNKTDLSRPFTVENVCIDFVFLRLANKETITENKKNNQHTKSDEHNVGNINSILNGNVSGTSHSLLLLLLLLLLLYTAIIVALERSQTEIAHTTTGQINNNI